MLLETMHPTVKEVLAKWNLFLNDDKTEFYLAEKTDKNKEHTERRSVEEEQSPRISHACGIRDIQRI